MTLYYKKYGSSNKVIMILPGWGDTRGTFDFLISNLKDDYTIYIFDYPGFGKSTFPNKDLSVYHYASFFRDFLKEKHIKNPVLIGHSFGGRISILLSGLYQIPFSKIILIDSAGIKPRKGFWKMFRQTLYKGLKRFKYLLPHNSREKYQKWLLKKFSSADYQTLPPQMMKTFQNIVHEDLKKYLKEMKTETLLIWGEADIDTPIQDAICMEREIPDSALIRISRATHYCYLEQPLLILRIIKQFID